MKLKNISLVTGQILGLKVSNGASIQPSQYHVGYQRGSHSSALLYVQPYITHQISLLPLPAAHCPTTQSRSHAHVVQSIRSNPLPIALSKLHAAQKAERINPSVGIGDSSAKFMVYSKKMHSNPSKTRRPAHQALIF